MKPMILQIILQTIVSEFGTSVLREHPRVLGLVADRYPQASKERRLLRVAFEAGVVEALRRDGGEHSQLSAMKLLEEEYSLHPDRARTLVVSLCEVLGHELYVSGHKAESDSTTATPAKTSSLQTAQLKPGSVFRDHPHTPEMVVIPAGEFVMGGNGYPDEQPIHRVKVPQFAIGKTMVTQAQWKAVMGNNPSYFQDTDTENCPLESVNWDDIQEFITKLNTLTGKKYRLPSEAEWEYACRAGSTGKWCFGDDEAQLIHYAWNKNNSDSKSHPVEQKRPNAFGLYDMHGNVWEWLQDCWHENYEGAPTDGSAWTTGDGGLRVVRGGSWNSGVVSSRVANRLRIVSTCRLYFYGFRLARMLP